MENFPHLTFIHSLKQGTWGAAANDAVQAAIRVIGKQLLTSTYGDLQGVENFPHLIFTDSNAFNNAKDSFLNGEGIGFQ